MITLTKSGNAIVFTFDDNDHYLNDGKIEVPVNSLTLVTDESQMATFKRSSTNDIFISATYAELGMSKSDLESWFKENACGSTGGGGGVTSGEVQTMIDESISGKADTSDVQNVATDVATVSGDVNTLSGQVETDEKVTATALNDLDNRKLDASAYTPTDLSNYYTKSQTNTQINNATEGLLNASTFNTYSANTDARISEDEEVTSAALNALDDALDDKADIEDIPTVVQTTGSSSADVMSQSAVTASINAVSGAIPTTYINSIQNDSSGGWDRFTRFSTPSNVNYWLLDNPKINDKQIHNFSGIESHINKFSLVETSAITSSVTSASTDAQVPSAKAVYDALQEGGGGGKAVSGGTNISVTTGETADTINCTLPISVTSHNANSIYVGNGNGDAFGNNCIVVGNQVTSNFDNSICVGSSLTAGAKNAQVFGDRTNASNEDEHVTGRLNITNKANNNFGDSGNTLFSVGNGYYYLPIKARHNAFEIRQNGDIYIADTNDTTYQNYYEKPMIKLQDALGGVPESAFTAYTAATEARLAEDEEVTAAGLNTLNTATAANTTALGGLKLVSLTQAQYEALTTKDASTLYIITSSN